MQNSRILKIITLSGFVILISSFVAYRSGAFSKGAVDEQFLANRSSEFSVDSPPAKNTKPSGEKVIMHSSKSGRIIREPERTTQAKPDTSKKTEIKIDETMMGSSKSAGVFKPNDFKSTPANQSTQQVKKDTVKKQKVK